MVWARCGRCGVVLEDTAGYWKDMPEKIEAACQYSPANVPLAWRLRNRRLKRSRFDAAVVDILSEVGKGGRLCKDLILFVCTRHIRHRHYKRQLRSLHASGTFAGEY
jgi:hypothetical protein